MANSVMASTQPTGSALWKTLYKLGIAALAVSVFIMAFAYVQTLRYRHSITTLKSAVSVLDKDISAAQKDPTYMRYGVAKEIVKKNTIVGWGDRLSRIMSVFAKLQQLGGANVRFSDFGLDFTSLHLKGVVSELKLVYGQGGVVDQFNALDFLQNISITNYQKTDQGYEFTLVAQVVLQNVGK